MKLKVTGKELMITEALNDYVEKKLSRIEKYFEDLEADVTLRTEKNEQIAEMNIYANGESYRAVTEDKDLYASIDKDIDILEGQIRKAKTKREKMQKDSSIKQITITGEESKTIEDEVVKTVYYEIRPMSIEDAKMKLKEKSNNIFLTFVNVDTGKVNVIFKLKDSTNFGIVEPEA